MSRTPRSVRRVIAHNPDDTPRVNLATENALCDTRGMAANKQTRELIGLLTEQGFIVKARKTPGHFGVFTADGEHVTDLCSSPSEYRGTKNALARLRRNGFEDPARASKKKKDERP